MVSCIYTCTKSTRGGNRILFTTLDGVVVACSVLMNDSTVSAFRILAISCSCYCLCFNIWSLSLFWLVDNVWPGPSSTFKKSVSFMISMIISWGTSLSLSSWPSTNCAKALIAAQVAVGDLSLSAAFLLCTASSALPMASSVGASSSIFFLFKVFWSYSFFKKFSFYFCLLN